LAAQNRADLGLQALPLERQHQLIAASRDKAVSVAYKLLRGWGATLERDEVVSAVDLALCVAARRFQPELQVNFLTFAFYSIRGILIRTIKSRIEHQETAYGLGRYESDADGLLAGEASGDHPLMESSGAAELECSPEHQFHLAELKSKCHEAFQQLGEFERKIVYWVDFKGHNVSATAKRLGYSRGHASMLRSLALRKMRAELWMYDEAA